MARIRPTVLVLAVAVMLSGCGGATHPRAGRDREFAYRTGQELVLANAKGVLARVPAPLDPGDDPRVDWTSQTRFAVGVAGAAIVGLESARSIGSIPCGCDRVFPIDLAYHGVEYPDLNGDIVFWRAPNQIMGVGLADGTDHTPKVLRTVDGIGSGRIVAVVDHATAVIDSPGGRIAIDVETGATRPYTQPLPVETTPQSARIPFSDSSVRLTPVADGAFDLYLVHSSGSTRLDTGVRSMVMDPGAPTA